MLRNCLALVIIAQIGLIARQKWHDWKAIVKTLVKADKSIHVVSISECTLSFSDSRPVIKRLLRVLL